VTGVPGAPGVPDASGAHVADMADMADVPGVTESPAGPHLSDVAERWPAETSAEMCSGSIVRLRRDTVRTPDGDLVGREVVEHPGAVAVLALDEAERVLLIRQYRHPVGRLLWEIPAGLRDVPGEPPQRTAERELLEEVGYRASAWNLLADYYSSPGMTTERIRIYLARGLDRVPDAERTYVPRHEEAHLLLAWVPLDEAVARFLAGDMHNGVAGLGILSAYAARRGGLAEVRDAHAPEC
jgi:8-oxo-dGDP phosphatase